MLDNLHKLNADKTPQVLQVLREDAMKNKNIFAALMEVCKYCSLGQITETMFEVGGQYRRNM
jgi:methylmalonyl-CoA mutase